MASCSLITCSIPPRPMTVAMPMFIPSLQQLKPAYWPWESITVGPLSVSPMGFGTWAWGNKLLWSYDESMDDELQAVFNLAVNTGINLFDTADSYGTGRLNGRSELLLGKFIRAFPGSEQKQRNINIATKFAAYPWRLTSRQFILACKASLRRLQCEQLALGQLHWSTANYAPFQEQALWNGLVAMYEEGLVQAVGVSNYGPKQLERVHAYLERKGVPLSTVQVQFSLLSNGPEQVELKALCESLGIKLIAYSPLGLGMLTGKYSPTRLPKGPRLEIEMASWTKASVGSSLSSTYRLQSPTSLVKAQSIRSNPNFRSSLVASAKKSKFKPLCNYPAERNPSTSAIDLPSRQSFFNPPSFIGRGTCLCYAVDGNSTTSSSSSNSTTTDADPLSPDKEQDTDYVAEYEEPESVGKALGQIRQERLVSGEESPSKTEDFWRGVLEEIQLIEWPSLQKVLSTTSVVTGIIIGSSLVLLTVNAMLAQLSDAVFKNVPPA